MEGEKYNGWTNYETWLVALWLDNEEGSYRYWRAEAADLWHTAAEEKPELIDVRSTVASQLALRMKHDVSQHPLASEPSLHSDLLNAALSEVDWFEIADGIAGEMEERTQTDRHADETAEAEKHHD